MGIDAIERVRAAVEHARMLMFRDETEAEVDEDLRALGRMTEVTADLPEDYAAAIELLAMVPPDIVDHFVSGYRAASDV